MKWRKSNSNPKHQSNPIPIEPNPNHKSHLKFKIKNNKKIKQKTLIVRLCDWLTRLHGNSTTPNPHRSRNQHRLTRLKRSPTSPAHHLTALTTWFGRLVLPLPFSLSLTLFLSSSPVSLTPFSFSFFLSSPFPFLLFFFDFFPFTISLFNLQFSHSHTDHTQTHRLTL